MSETEDIPYRERHLWSGLEDNQKTWEDNTTAMNEVISEAVKYADMTISAIRSRRQYYDSSLANLWRRLERNFENNAIRRAEHSPTAVIKFARGLGFVDDQQR